MTQASRGQSSPFAATVGQYHFDTGESRSAFFERLVTEELRHRRANGDAPIRALDIGCGKGIEGNPESLRRLRSCVDEFWGIEPDAGISIPTGVFDTVRNSLVESAQLPAAYFDVAYAYLVAEHVEHPHAFLGAVRTALKPGGALFLLTPNARHLFGIASRVLERTGLDEFVLRRLRPAAVVADYHYPVKYRMNTDAELRRLWADAGFAHGAVTTFEDPADTRPYFPGPLSIVWRALIASRRARRSADRLLHLVARLEA